MTDYSIKLKPVFSAPADSLPRGVKLPDGWSSLSWHQKETLDALNNPEVDVVLNVAMTGDGKSLAAYLKPLTQKLYSVISLYPTNELARDQELQIQKYIELFQPKFKPRYTRLSGELLEVYAENEGLKKGAAIATRTGQSEILMSNPDIFHYLHRGAYLTPLDNRDKLWGRINQDFGLFIFDEFHIFSAPQVSSVLNTMLLIRTTQSINKKFLFLSATPDEEFIERLKKAGFNCHVINPEKEHKYQFPVTKNEQKELLKQNWRKVVSDIDLKFIPLESTSRSSEIWLKDNAEIILEQFTKTPSKGAIILNSVAAVKRLVRFFQDFLEPHGFTVGENTGLTSSETKKKSLSTDLVIGTSTIDVGVDFKINFLFFESADSGNFIQRLGRLGRHESYQKNGETIEFYSFTAFALVPNFFVERLFEKDDASLILNKSYERPFFYEVIKAEYRNINDFLGYYKQWGGFQSFKLFLDLNQKTIAQTYAESKKVFVALAEDVFDMSLSRVAGKWKYFEYQWRDLSGKKGNPIAEEACSFRGSSDLQCGLYDLTEQNEQFRFKTYGLPGILSNLEIEPMTEAEFRRSLDQTIQQTGQPIAKGRFNYCLAFMKLMRYRDERLDWKFTYNGDLQDLINRWEVQVLAGFEIWQPDNRWISAINKRLSKQGMVAYLLPRPVSEVRARLRLPMHFQIYPICDRHSFHDPKAPYSIAFGQSALLIDTLAYCFKQDGGKALIF
ncbi:type I-D CRISPR-associated helicase Cas3' [[Limnothrix rosea] IAM M-220]|uniref:type I-D CRISPR-associated helicase Cas3' n=1 Tax=[Limnothrix rosea] IAM M-220 TaxID=454133 RepID=UPI0009683C53|nr:type I-D CRISPR-associated helicase Cas3' [[Limnothrix rosea] IAM M-220]OKH17968.1 type I-D CRISPR-associated helicase Cas3' [[Limnothrix rosea] IAM M-220]